MWNVTCFWLETVLVSVQDRCMVYARCTIGLQIVLDHPMELLGDMSHVEYRFFPFGDRYRLGDVGHVESHFILFGDSVSVGAR